jgi:biopolymer transport protein ExbD
MRFTSGKKRRAPTVIIVSLIDVLLVVLIFLMVTTTAKKEPPPILRLALPESKQAKPGSKEDRPFVIAIATNAPYFYIEEKPVTLERLQNELMTAAKKDPKVAVTIKADRRAPFGEVIRVIDAAKIAQVGSINAVTEKTAQR